MSDVTPLDRAATVLKTARSVAVLSGAGASAESGVPTFRASDGLWEGHNIEDVATPDGFARNPGLVWQFYNARRENVNRVAPNAGHRALAAMERHWGDHFTLVTQNVDGLHQRAGNTNVLELHGSLRQTRCTRCHAVEDRGLDPLGDRPVCPACNGWLRPHIVWFHEPLPDRVWSRAAIAAEEADVFLVVGTSAVVYPAASLITYAKRSQFPGATVIECNLTPTDASDLADIGLYGPAGVTLPALCSRLGIGT